MGSVTRFMTHREIELLTGTKRRQDQVELLCEIGIPVEVSALGIPKVWIEEVVAELPFGDDGPEPK